MGLQLSRPLQLFKMEPTDVSTKIADLLPEETKSFLTKIQSAGFKAEVRFAPAVNGAGRLPAP